MTNVHNNTRFGGKQAALNMITQGGAFAVNLLIGFFLTPFIVKHIGSTANGFFALSSNIINFASLFVIALNSMAGRFIAIAYFQKREEDVQKYYSSVFIANVVICLVFSIPAIAFLIFLPSILQVPVDLFRDVTILFAFTFIQFAIMHIGSIFNNSAAVVNRLELLSYRSIEAKVLGGCLIFLTFSISNPHLWQVGLIHVLTTCYVVVRDYRIHRMVMPQVRIQKKYFEWCKIRELIASGVWNSISSLGGILFDNVDLLIINIFISAATMGVVSVAKVIPNCLAGLICSMASAVAPMLTKDFAEGSSEKIVKNLLFNMRLMGFFVSIAVAFMVVFGIDFYRLWMSSMDAGTLWLISLVAFVFMPIGLSVNPLAYVFTSANKVKINSLVYLGYAALSLITMFFLLRSTHNVLWQMLIVVAISKIFNLLQIGTFTVPYVAKLLSVKCAPFFLAFAKVIFSTLWTIGVCVIVHYIIPVKGWLTLAVAGGLTTIAGVVIGWLLLFSQEEKEVLLEFLKKKLPFAGK